MVRDKWLSITTENGYNSDSPSGGKSKPGRVNLYFLLYPLPTKFLAEFPTRRLPALSYQRESKKRPSPITRISVPCDHPYKNPRPSKRGGDLRKGVSYAMG